MRRSRLLPFMSLLLVLLCTPAVKALDPLTVGLVLKKLLDSIGKLETILTNTIR